MIKENSSLESGYILDQKYVIGKVLGIGGFGMTYLAKSIWTQEEFAIKEYFPSDWAERCQDKISIRPKEDKRKGLYEHGLEVFVNEAKILKGLSEDNVVVNVKDFFYENNTGYIVMEYIDGVTLERYMKSREKPISLRMSESIISGVARSMAKIHELGLLHRDISPDNIMILPNGKVKLIDFGATRQYVLNETTDMSIMIKPGFAPMEQYSRTGRQGPWTDVYALAATFYYIVSGKKPLSAVDRCAGEKLIPLSSIKKDVSKDLSDIIEKAMELDYTKRIQDMDTFIKEFERAYKGEGNESPHLLLKKNGKIKKWKFSPNQSIKIGRDSNECDISVEESDISRVHCEVIYDQTLKQFKIIDRSKNGTYTKNGLIGKSRYAMINSGDMFSLVNNKIKFLVEVR